MTTRSAVRWLSAANVLRLTGAALRRSGIVLRTVFRAPTTLVLAWCLLVALPLAVVLTPDVEVTVAGQ